MKEGEPVLGGPQVTPGNIQPANPGVQPMGFETLQNTQATQSAQAPSQTFAPNNTAGGGVQLNNLAPQPQPISQLHQFQPQTQSQFPAQSTSIISGTGDITLNNTPPKKSKKGLIIAIIVAMIIIGVSALFLVIGTINKGTQEDLFGNFISYLENGNNSNVDMADFNADDIYAIDTYYYSDNKEERRLYFEQLDQLWTKFTESYKSEDSLVKEIDNSLSIVKLYVDKGIVPIEEILKQYIENGESGVRSYFSNYYTLSNDVSDMEMQFLSYQDDYIKDALSFIQLYYINGCIINNTVNEVCIEEKNLYSEKEYKQMMLTLQSIRNFVNNAEKQTKITCEELIEKDMAKQ